MKEIIAVAVAVFGTTLAWAQSTPSPPPGAISRPAQAPATSSGPLGSGNLTFTNETGRVYSMDDLAAQLGNLRAALDQALPVLSAFNAEFGAGSGRGGSLADALSRILSGRRGQTAGGSSGSGSGSMSNIVGVLGGLLGTNATASGTASLDPGTLQELKALQEELEAIPPILQRLNITNEVAVTGSRGDPATGRYPSSGDRSTQPGTSDGVLTPTGR